MLLYYKLSQILKFLRGTQRAYNMVRKYHLWLTFINQQYNFVNLVKITTIIKLFFHNLNKTVIGFSIVYMNLPIDV